MSTRTYRNQEAAKPLIDALNGRLGGSFAAEVAEVLGAAKSGISAWQDGRQDMHAIETLNQFFSRYRMFARFGAGSEVPFDSFWTVLEGIDSHLDAVLALHDLIAYEWPDQVQRCLSCSKWFYRRFSHQSCCTELCRANFQRSPEQKARKRDDMKKFRQAEKLRILRQDQLHKATNNRRLR